MEKPTIHLHIDTLIGKFVVINIPFEDNKNSNQSPKHSFEHLKSEVESALIKILGEIDINKVISQKEHLCNSAQKEDC